MESVPSTMQRRESFDPGKLKRALWREGPGVVAGDWCRETELVTRQCKPTDCAEGQGNKSEVSVLAAEIVERDMARGRHLSRPSRVPCPPLHSTKGTCDPSTLYVSMLRVCDFQVRHSNGPNSWFLGV